MKPDWEDAPEGAKILVQQDDGVWVFGSYEKAVPSKNGGWDGIGEGCWFCGKSIQGSRQTFWEETLEHRPSGIETPEEKEEFDRIEQRIQREAGSGQGRKQYSAYFKDVRHIDYIDVYRAVDLFDCEKHGHPISHAAKKLLLTGARTGGKDVETEVREAIDSLYRWLEMREEDRNAL